MATILNLTTGVVYLRGAADGSITAPSYPFFSEPTSGWYRAGAGDIRLAVLGVDRIKVAGAILNLQGSDGGAYFTTGSGGTIVNSSPFFMQNGGTAKFQIPAVGATDGQILLANGANTAGIGADFATDGTFKIRNRTFTAATGNLDLGGKLTAYNGVTTAGWGTGAVQAHAVTGTLTNVGSASIATFTVGAADGVFRVSADASVTVSTTHTFSLDVTYTDVTNTARTMTLPVNQLAGTFIASGLITNVTGAGPYESASMVIRAKAATAIVVRTSAGGTFTTVTFTASGTITQVG